MSTSDSGTPVSDRLDEALQYLRSVPLDGVDLPVELFLGPVAGGGVPGPNGVDWVGATPGSAAALARDLRRGATTVAAGVEAAFARIRRDDHRIQAWALLDEVGAAAAAQALDGELADGNCRGPLHGIPIGVKDIIDVAGVRTGAGSRQWSDPGREHVPAHDAGVVTMLRQAGAVVVGKTTTHEFAFGGTTPPTRNPHDLDRIPGGSSGGSAAAVAAGHVRVAIGTDTCGSVRIPSSYCGTVGMIPTPGLLPRTGVAPLAWSLDRVGFITRTVEDLAWTADALGLCQLFSGTDAQAPSVLHGLRIGVPAEVSAPPIDRAVAEHFESACDILRAAGAQLLPIEIPLNWVAVTAGVVIFLSEGLDFHRERWTSQRELFGADVQGTLELAEQVLAADYVRAQRLRRAIRSQFLAKLSQVDVLLTPTMPCTAPLVAQASLGTVRIVGAEVSIADAHLRYNVGANLAGLPAATQPIGADAGGLPIGLEWLAAPGRDGQMLAIMHAFEVLTCASGEVEAGPFNTIRSE